MKQAFVIILLFASVISAQSVLDDSLAVQSDSTTGLTSLDSLHASGPDSLPPAKKKADLEGPIKYWAELISLQDNGNIIQLSGNAKMEYQDMTLTAAHIKIDRQTNTLYAQGSPDSVDADSNLVYTSTPVFTEKGDEPMHGDFIEYNFKIKRGKITMGTTKMDPGYYKGEQINKIGEKTLLVKTGYFTSCEYIDNPHFYFKSDQMRMKVKDKVVAKPIVFYIADVPLGWFPFGIFPNKRGRHSGIVIPKYGENRVGGRFLRDMGYYWVPNDYFDAKFLVDFYDKIGFSYSTDFRYKIRYLLNGSLSGEYFPRDPSSGLRKERWRIRYNHSQTIDPTLRISGNGSFVSDKNFSRQLSSNVDDRLNQNLTSTLSLNKSWKGTKNSMSLSFYRNENLSTESTTMTLPKLSFNRSQSSIYETITGKKLGAARSWYQNIYFSYNANGERTEAKKNVTPKDSIEKVFEESTKQGIRHNLSFSSPQKVLKYFNITPSVSYTEDWVDKINAGRYDDSTGKVIESAKNQFAARRTFSGSIGTKTTLYGLFEPNIGNLKFIRHKMDPSVSFSFAPNFSDPSYGYVKTFYDSSGKKILVDKFSKSMYGGTSRGETRRMSMSLANNLQGKLIDDEGKEKKIDLLTANFSTGYNFLRDSLRFDNLSSSIRTKIMGKDLSFTMVHTFYKPNSKGESQINKFEKFPRLLSFRTSYGFTIDNKTFRKKEGDEGLQGRQNKKTTTENENGNQDQIDQDEGVLESGGIQVEERDYIKETKNISLPWSASFNLNYSLNKSNINDPDERIDLTARAKFELTKNWKVSWNARFDLVEKEITTNSFSIYRDLHCWEMSFDWQPLREYYSFQINVKASALQDIKVTKHPSRSVYTY
ncbi:MAG: LPS-assembly protein LptD [Calditrichaceae bacterium]|nr:LPS-assembly protein LptD [Calditrichaceae bacterium]